MKPLYRSTLLHDAYTGNLGWGSGHKLGSARRGGDVGDGFADQSLGAGHNPGSSDSGGGAFSRVPPRMFGSALNGHGGHITSPAWPLGYDWADTGLNALGTGTKRHRYWWRCCALIASTDTLTWGPSEIGIATDVNGISFGSVTGVAYRIASRTGDGSLFPNREEGWELQSRIVRSSPTVPLPNPSGGIPANTRLNLTFVYLDAAAPILRVYLGRGVAGAYNGLSFDAPQAHNNQVYGPYANGRVNTWGHKIKIDELEDTEDPWADILRVG